MDMTWQILCQFYVDAKKSSNIDILQKTFHDIINLLLLAMTSTFIAKYWLEVPSVTYILINFMWHEVIFGSMRWSIWTMRSFHLKNINVYPVIWTNHRKNRNCF